MKAFAAIDRVLGPMSWLVAALVAVLLFAGPSLIGAKEEGAAAKAAADYQSGSAPAADASDGKAVFEKASCGACHTFKAAGSTGVSGPDLDAAAPDAAGAEAKIRGGGGGMPAFEGELTDAEIAALAAFVSGG